jgi:hypothetical protein
MLGCIAAVMETESPSQLMPSEVQRIWTSSTPPALFLRMGFWLLKCLL